MVRFCCSRTSGALKALESSIWIVYEAAPEPTTLWQSSRPGVDVVGQQALLDRPELGATLEVTGRKHVRHPVLIDGLLAVDPAVEPSCETRSFATEPCELALDRDQLAARIAVGLQRIRQQPRRIRIGVGEDRCGKLIQETHLFHRITRYLTR